MEDTITISCPHCGEPIEIAVDLSAGRRQEYTEDCSVCCQPNVITLQLDRDGHITVMARPENP